MTVVKFDIKIIDDDLFEGNEMFNLHIIPSSLPSHVKCGNQCSATVTIVDDEERKYVHSVRAIIIIIRKEVISVYIY